MSPPPFPSSTPPPASGQNAHSVGKAGGGAKTIGPPGQWKGGGVFPGLIDLASERIGGRVLAASDEFFAPKENLIKPGRGVLIPDKFTKQGKWMDGWETRRSRRPLDTFDWCVIQLGLPGFIKGIDIDTNHFLGNHPSFAAVDACEDTLGEKTGWTPVLPASPLRPGSQNLFSVPFGNPPKKGWQTVRLKIYPDGGVARLRIYGEVVKDWTQVKETELVDLAAMVNGGQTLVCSDMFFSSMENLIMPSLAQNMADGWETCRKRGPGHDWVIIKLGRVGCVQKLEIDTSFFKGNFPEQASVEGCLNPNGATTFFLGKEAEWKTLLPLSPLGADAKHFFENEIQDRGPFSHLRLNIFPDGGVARFRAFGYRKLL